MAAKSFPGMVVDDNVVATVVMSKICVHVIKLNPFFSVLNFDSRTAIGENLAMLAIVDECVGFYLKITIVKRLVS
jgi:hypothetical protein